MRISPRKVSGKPRNTSSLGSASSGLWNFLRRRLFLVSVAIACFYVTLSGHLYMANDDRYQQQHHEKTNSNPDYLKEIEQRTGHTYVPAVVNFTGYPLTREGMIATGAQMGRSVVERFQVKKQQPQKGNTNNHWWCRPRPANPPEKYLQQPRNNTQNQGLFFVKTPKTASQSINRILKRTIARVRGRTGRTCHLRGHHIQGDPAAWYGHRHQFHSVLLTSLRDPVPRALSRIWWTLSTRQFTSAGIDVALLEQALTRWTETETGVISNGQGGFQLNYVSFPVIPPQSAWKPNQPFQVQDPDQVHGYIEQALQEYDFFLVQERLDESLVALQLLLGLETADILSMPLHVGGSYLYDRIAGCIELVPPPKLSGEQPDTVLVPFLKNYFSSPQWLAQNYGDYLLWGAAQASLDQTIEKLGLSRFQTALEEFHQLQEAVMQTCSQQVVFPCSHNGTIQREDYKPGNKNANGDRYPQADIEACIDQVVAKRLQSKWQNA
ncbi:expressed unknown protein [Seminavis robusta]|uniref:Uncharacterized protein n=1 Tax=Seminavis robusta TaxID=568900 RepID=A0A9N8F3Z5_9STRA|nr:expressed unknown protein [Seminavis robusta]|eukprot:Sro3322_g346760.1 n/a (494) ;mRNA; r:2688-4169